MLSSYKNHDLFPNYRPAGVGTVYNGDSTATCVKPEGQLPPPTPDRIKRYRQSAKNAFGVTNTHYGKVNDYLPPQSYTYGVKSNHSLHVGDVLKDDAIDGLKGYIRDIKESEYPSRKQNPLGHSVSRSYQWPSKVTNKGFAFGVSVIASEPLKDIMYSQPGAVEDEQNRLNYIKSHAQWEAGEQVNRNYKWPVDPSKHVFGKSGQAVLDQIKFCVHPETSGESFPKTILVKKNVEDFKDFAEYGVGKTKNLGQTNSLADPNRIYGYKPKEKEPWTAGKCISGEAIMREIQPDADLGKSIRFGFRNSVQPGDENRVFGIPSIRTDVKKPLIKSVADPFSYGDDPQAIELLAPERFSDMGVTKKDFEQFRPKEEIRKLFANIGYNYKPGKFEGVFQRAQEICGSISDAVSVDAFIKAVKEMDHM